ncbi:thioredoxin [Aquicoccus porphyridii]|uniref:Thioredoxin n=1 Tax=Aquicoccus porphyridii TaxID=1852029 RepID=A0A5A9ZSJ9_9RHOB|nr:thioredoxin family protein [Aquicoccus porphyridii]KAA0920293.1 thioredoxin [Aquicoccus porphyridii]RAI54911.1 thioredoxin [Rhodobacteraceae bacterium AsT-22]
MLTRRNLFLSAAAGAAAGPLWAAGTNDPAAAPVELGDDGLHKQPWFLDSFLELGDDLQMAAESGRNLMVLWEQNGCPYCRELHHVNFQRPEIVDYIEAHYDVIQLDMFGAREVLGFDGQALEERRLAEKWFVNFTPTTILFHRDNAGAGSLRAAETFRLPGYLKPFHYLSALEYVETGDFRNQPFQRHLQDKFERLREQGIDPDVW